MELSELKKAMNDLYRSLPECPACDHRNDTHYMNCIECCPAKKKGDRHGS